MIRDSLEIFVRETMENAAIGPADLRRLQREVLKDGIETRDEVDVLIALDRAIAEKDGGWGAFLIRAVTDYVVWTSRPTGYVGSEAATWLVASLGCGSGPTDLALSVAFEIVREAQGVDEALLAFVMRFSRGRAAMLDNPPLDLAAW